MFRRVDRESRLAQPIERQPNAPGLRQFGGKRAFETAGNHARLHFLPQALPTRWAISGKASVDVGLKALKGELPSDFPKFNLTTPALITKENVDKFYRVDAVF